MSEHDHDHDEDFFEVNIGYVESFNNALNIMGQIRYRALMPKNTRTFSVASKYGVKIVIFLKEHLPPHFHVCAKGEKAAFSIETGERLKGSKGLKNKDKQIKIIWAHGRYEILEQWNRLRPDDLANQIMNVPSFWPPKEDISKLHSFDKSQIDDWKR
jgi:hypothetical protein